MVRIKDELGVGDNEQDWKMLYTNNDHIWVSPKENRFAGGGVLYPSPYEILDHLKTKYNNPMVVTSINLFENDNGLSTQVPMKHVYYTDCKGLCEWSEHLGHIRLVFSEDTYQLLRYQLLILGLLDKQ